MFGANTNTVQSTWGTPQQNQQQPQGSGFGQPNAFGTGGKSKSFLYESILESCPQQLLAPQTPLLSPSNSSLQIRCLEIWVVPALLAHSVCSQLSILPLFSSMIHSLPGGFGQSAPQPATTSVFGAPKPATGFGSFGTTSAFNNPPNTFGAANTAATPGAGLFSNASTGNAFGGSTLFGKPAATAFGTPRKF